MTSLPLWINRRSAKSENLPTQKKLFYVHPNNVVLNFTEFKKNILKFMNLLNFKRPRAAFSIYEAHCRLKTSETEMRTAPCLCVQLC